MRNESLRGYADLRHTLGSEAEVLIGWIDAMTHDEKCWVLQRFEELKRREHVSMWVWWRLRLQCSGQVWCMLYVMLQRYWSVLYDRRS